MPAPRTRRARAARKRQRRMASVEHDLSPGEWAALQEAWGGLRLLRRARADPLQKDCVLADLPRRSLHARSTSSPRARSCNASKCNDEVTGWLRRKRLDERAFLVRLATVQAELRQTATAPCPPAPPAAR